MTSTGNAEVLAAIKARDLEWLTEHAWTTHDRHPDDDIRGLLKDRRELLRILTEIAVDAAAAAPTHAVTAARPCEFGKSGDLAFYCSTHRSTRTSLDGDRCLYAYKNQHEPGTHHRYRIECEVCGQRGTIRLSIDPDLAAAGTEPEGSVDIPVSR